MLRESRLTTGICSSRIEIMGFCQKTRKEANHPMKHQLLALLLGSLLLLGLPAACADTPTMTVLMYMCGTDLQSDCVNDLYEMCAADIPDNVTVVVQAGGASQWDDSRLRANHINRFTIADYDFSDVEVCAWQSMGAQNTLEDYLTWATSTYPADRYMLIFWSTRRRIDERRLLRRNSGLRWVDNSRNQRRAVQLYRSQSRFSSGSHRLRRLLDGNLRSGCAHAVLR